VLSSNHIYFCLLSTHASFEQNSQAARTYQIMMFVSESKINIPLNQLMTIIEI
jgi:hypothetical protein